MGACDYVCQGGKLKCTGSCWRAIVTKYQTTSLQSVLNLGRNLFKTWALCIIEKLRPLSPVYKPNALWQLTFET